VNTEIICMQNIWKFFPGGVVANKSASLNVETGEIHAIVGENGAGKSTLMNILYGLHLPDKGDILLNGKHKNITNPRIAKKLGIGMVHQHFMLVPSFTVLQNIIIGYEPKYMNVFINETQASRIVSELCARYHLDLPLNEKVANLSVGLQQRVEIIKTVYRGANILILDEPTAVLTPQEADELIKICREMANQNKTILFISHKLREVLKISDRITVMRSGKTLQTVNTAETNERELACLIVGRERIWTIPTLVCSGENKPVLEIKDISILDHQNRNIISNFSIQVNAGEIVGVAGVEGNGQSELMNCLAGLLPTKAGSVTLNQKDITHTSVAKRRLLGIRHIPEDRMETGLCLKASITENMIVDPVSRKRFINQSGFIKWKCVEKYACDKIQEFKVLAPSGQTLVKNLSGGNMQKVVAAREFSGDYSCLLVMHPTRGLDIGASEFIYQQLLDARKNGKAILLVSADLDELFLVSDRIVVIYEGQLVAEFLPQDVTPESLGLYMTGAEKKTKEILYET